MPSRDDGATSILMFNLQNYTKHDPSVNLKIWNDPNQKLMQGKMFLITRGWVNPAESSIKQTCSTDSNKT